MIARLCREFPISPDDLLKLRMPQVDIDQATKMADAWKPPEKAQ